MMKTKQNIMKMEFPAFNFAFVFDTFFVYCFILSLKKRDKLAFWFAIWASNNQATSVKQIKGSNECASKYKKKHEKKKSLIETQITKKMWKKRKKKLSKNESIQSTLIDK